MNTTIIVPIGIGDIIYEKHIKFKYCRYMNDKYAYNGIPNCAQHEYDCCSEEEGGKPCDAIHEYYVTDHTVTNDDVLYFAKRQILREEDKPQLYLLTKEDANTWVEQKTKEENNSESTKENITEDLMLMKKV